MESMGPGGATFAQVCLLLNVFGTAISYLVATSSILELVIGVFTDDPPEILKRRNIVFIIGFLVVLPLGLFRQMGALRFTSLSGDIKFTSTFVGVNFRGRLPSRFQ